MRHYFKVTALAASALVACSDDTALPTAEQTPNYFGGDNVNHTHTRTVKNIFKSDRNPSTAAPYFNSIWGTAGTTEINEWLDLNCIRRGA